MSWERSSHRLQIPAKRYRIGELVRNSPFSRQTIHNYTIMGLIREAEWTEGGHRLDDETVFERLSRIMELKESMSLNEIRRTLNEEDKIAQHQAHGTGRSPSLGPLGPYRRDGAAEGKGDPFMSSETP